jgi:RNA polymerase subunit RPABC4/transcription elongation factor Spt4
LLFFPLFPLPGLLLYWILRPRETLAEIYERSLEEETLLQGIEERLACPGCNRRIEETFMICPTCHTRLKKGCPSCGQLLHLRWNICPYCGAVQTAAKAAPAVAPQPVPMSVEKPQVAMLSGATMSSPEEPPVEAEVEPWPVEEPQTDSEPDPEGEANTQEESDSDAWPETLPFDFD